MHCHCCITGCKSVLTSFLSEISNSGGLPVTCQPCGCSNLNNVRDIGLYGIERYDCKELQWNLRIKDTLGAELLSSFRRLSFGGRFEPICNL